MRTRARDVILDIINNCNVGASDDLIIQTHSLNNSTADDRYILGTEYGLIKFVMLDKLMARNNWGCQANVDETPVSLPVSLLQYQKKMK